jgi:hypothetical protein
VITTSCAFLAFVALANADLRVTVADVDPEVVASGLSARLGAGADDWSITVQPGTLPGRVHLRLQPPSGDVVERDVELDGDDPQSRARQLASILALIIEQTQDRAGDSTSTQGSSSPDPKPPLRAEGWIAAIGRTALNARRPLGADPGLGLAGGVWLDRLHIQPVAQLGWGRTTAPGLKLDGIRFGAGLLAGGVFDEGRFWAGAGAIAHAMWARARAERRVADWFSVTEVFGTLQYRGGWWTLGARLGIDVVLPPLSARSDTARTRWDAARPAASVLFGVRIPPRIRGRTAH